MNPLNILATVCLLLSTIAAQTVEPVVKEKNESMPVIDSMIYFTPNNLTGIKEGNLITVNWYTTLPGASDVIYITQDDTVSNIVNWTHNFDEDLEGNYTGYGSFIVETLFLGHSSFNLTIIDIQNNTLGSAQLIGTVLLPYQAFNIGFTYTMLMLTFIAYINMGATLDLIVVVKTLKRPVGPVVGVICQYTIMPLCSYGLARFFFPGQPLMQLGMFLIGSSPGGGLSNIWTYLFGGSLDLSVTMTLASTIVAFGAVPMWVFSLGPTIFVDTDFQIPFLNIVGLIIMLVIPCGLGVLIQLWRPKWAKFIKEHVLKKIAIFNALFVLTVGAYAYRYVFSMFTFTSVLAAFLLPVCGYLCGFIIATIVRRSMEDKIAISIETGVQNAQIPILILKLSLGSPTGDLAIVVPAAIVVLTPLTLFVIYIIKTLLVRVSKGKKAEITSDKKSSVPNGKTNESYDTNTSEENSYPVVSIHYKKDDLSHRNPGFISDGRHSNGVNSISAEEVRESGHQCDSESENKKVKSY